MGVKMTVIWLTKHFAAKSCKRELSIQRVQLKKELKRNVLLIKTEAALKSIFVPLRLHIKWGLSRGSLSEKWCKCFSYNELIQPLQISPKSSSISLDFVFLKQLEIVLNNA